MEPIVRYKGPLNERKVWTDYAVNILSPENDKINAGLKNRTYTKKLENGGSIRVQTIDELGSLTVVDIEIPVGKKEETDKDRFRRLVPILELSFDGGQTIEGYVAWPDLEHFSAFAVGRGEQSIDTMPPQANLEEIHKKTITTDTDMSDFERVDREEMYEDWEGDGTIEETPSYPGAGYMSRFNCKYVFECSAAFFTYVGPDEIGSEFHLSRTPPDSLTQFWPPENPLDFRHGGGLMAGHGLEESSYWGIWCAQEYHQYLNSYSTSFISLESGGNRLREWTTNSNTDTESRLGAIWWAGFYSTITYIEEGSVLVYFWGVYTEDKDCYAYFFGERNYYNMTGTDGWGGFNYYISDIAAQVHDEDDGMVDYYINVDGKDYFVDSIHKDYLVRARVVGIYKTGEGKYAVAYAYGKYRASDWHDWKVRYGVVYPDAVHKQSEYFDVIDSAYTYWVPYHEISTSRNFEKDGRNLVPFGSLRLGYIEEEQKERIVYEKSSY